VPIRRRRILKQSHLEELVFAVTLLAGVSAFLLKLIEYCNSNIIQPKVFFVVELLVIILILEILTLVLFLLIRGYSVWPIGLKPNKMLNELATKLRPFMFFIPVTLLLYILTAYIYLSISENWNLPHFVNLIVIYFIFTISMVISYYLGGGTVKNLLKNPIHHWVILIVMGFGLLFGIFSSNFLLTGDYSIEILDINDNTISFKIMDTGRPSAKCWITLYKLNESKEELFQQIDFAILNDISKNSSTHGYITGIKRDGAYYVFLNLSNLSSGYYLLHAEVTYRYPNAMNRFLESIFIAKKYDNLLFYVPSQN